MKIQERKETTEIKMVTTGVKCDVCGKVHEGKYAPNEWHEFSHHHNHWGNDSIESYVYHEVCSPECYAIKFKECVKDLGGREDAKVDGFEIQFARRLANLL